MTDLVNKGSNKEIASNDSVTGSVIYRQISREDSKKLEKLAKKIAREKGLIINFIEK